MTLLFGNLTNQFVIFQSVVNKVDQGDEQAANDLPAAAAAFRHVASKDALYLVVIGVCPQLTYTPLFNRAFKVSACSSAPISTCMYGFILPRPMQSVFGNDTCGRFCARTSHFLTKLEQER